ncbi:MAG: acyl--CoA ligase, partial [Candidatus Helarchaeota archaeon]|nr:acyl--CoA ligase [Candidatus Helarchaeota archaeon]
MKSILDALEINKNANPDKIAVLCENNALTYSELYEYSDRLANKLRQIGLVKGNVVALMFPNIIEFVVSYFAVLKAGGIVLTINVIDNVEDIKFILEDSGVRCIIYWNKFKDLFENVLKRLRNRVLTISLGGKDLKNQLSYQYSSGEMDDRYKRIVIEENDISSILYTSGATGSSKGAMHSHKNFAFVSKIWKELVSITPEDKFLAV